MEVNREDKFKESESKENRDNSDLKILCFSIKDESRFITRLSLIYVIIVLIIKSIAQLQTNSIAFFAEFIDSILDFTIVAITWAALKYGNREPDFDHMFGHYKINSFGGLVEAILTIVIYSMIFYNAGSAFWAIIANREYKIENSAGAVESLIIVMVINVFVSGFVLKIGKKNQNQTILAQGANFRGDLYRNLSVVGGLILVEFGFDFLDPIIAMVFSIFAIKESAEILNASFKELTDYNAISEKRIDDLKSEILRVRGIYRIDEFSIRTAGKFADIDIKITLGSRESIYSMTRINNKVMELVDRHFPEYKCNTIIQIISKESRFMYQEIIDIIKDIGDHSDKCENIHSIILDILEDEVLVQFHVQFSPDLTLNMAHGYISEVELTIRKAIEDKFPSKKIEIISHIESLGIPEKEHEHKNSTDLNEEVRRMVIDEVNKMPEIVGFHHLNILHENTGIFITIHIKLEGNLKITEAHLICERLEFNLKARNGEIRRTVIHPEPASY